MPDLILFDFDGTLADSRPAIMATMRYLFQLGGQLIPSDEAIRSVIGYGLAKGIQELAPSLNPTDVDQWVELYRQHYLQADQQTQLYPGAVELLKYVRGEGIPMVIVSNKTQKALVIALKRLGIADYFQRIVGEQSGQPLKPDPQLWQQVIQPFVSVRDPRRILFIGDTPTDIIFAKNCQIPVCWVSFGYGHASDCLPLEPESVVSSLDAIPDILKLGRQQP